MVASDSFAEFLRKQLALLGRLAMRRIELDPENETVG